MASDTPSSEKVERARSSRLLIDEPALQVLPSLAKQVGLEEAIVLQQVHYWVIGGKSGRMHEGRRWIWNSYTEWEAQFPFWSAQAIGRHIRSLEKQGLLLSAVLNAMTTDRTKSYTIDYDALEALTAGRSYPPEDGEPPESGNPAPPHRSNLNDGRSKMNNGHSKMNDGRSKSNGHRSRLNDHGSDLNEQRSEMNDHYQEITSETPPEITPTTPACRGRAGAGAAEPALSNPFLKPPKATAQLETAFCRWKGVSPPARETARQQKKARVRWDEPLAEMLALCAGDQQHALDTLERSVQHCLDARLTADAPASVLKVFASKLGEERADLEARAPDRRGRRERSRDYDRHWDRELRRRQQQAQARYPDLAPAEALEAFAQAEAERAETERAQQEHARWAQGAACLWPQLNAEEALARAQARFATLAELYQYQARVRFMGAGAP